MKKILFIEDESALQKSLGERLKEEGYKIISALDGETGLKIAQKQIPDLIILDIILPKMDGFEVLTQLKQKEETKNIPIIILTNLENTESVEKALELGANIYLVKANYTLNEIIEKIKETVCK